ncbi:glycosyltransferase family 4 protein [Pelomonas sp. SE-A7]|uniref:glycosyltransferase family 4 protein n=1 Tax=Pelomonas sp. SE-A7 TaxID=3054953 RepID=UPI00259C7026|nr:glycosyltransferase family 4 protein [Pelomonas sp. SE-A7]MDM4767530.1 glycosyltransferase family 4 protein [Pelomonas sp. SE-A7]
MRVLLLSQHFWPESFAINEVAAALVQQGCEVTVLTGKPNYPEGRVFGGYRVAGIQRESYQGCEIVRVPLLPRGPGGALRLILNYLSFVASASVLGSWALRGRRFDVIFVYGTSPILQAIAAVVLKCFKKAALVTWVQDLWPESLQLTGYVSSPRLLAATAAVVRWIYKRCDLLLVQSRGFIAPVQALAGATPVRYHPNPGRLPAPVTAGGPRLGEGFKIVFAGNLGMAQGLDTVLDAAALLGPGSDIRWVLVGSGARSDWLAAQVQQRGLQAQVLLPGRFEPEQMGGIYAQADVLLVSLKRDEALSRTVPSKLQDYLGAGRPILAALDGEGAALVTEAGAGLACPAEDAAALAAAALQLKQASAGQREAMAGAARRCFDASFEPEALARTLRAHLAAARDEGQSAP